MFQKVIQPANAFIGDQQLDYEGRPKNEAIAKLLLVAPGPVAITALLEIEKSDLSPADRIDYLKCWQRQSAWVSLQEQNAMLFVSGSHYQEANSEKDVDQEGREDVSTALRLSPATSQEKIDVARVLFNNLPATVSALNSGEIPPQTATVIAKEVAVAIRAGLSDEAVQEVERIALAHAEFHTPAQVGKKLKTTFANLAPDLFQKEFDIQREARSVRFFQERNGVGTLLATLNIEDAQLADKVISDYADNILNEHRQAMLNLVRFSRGHNCIKNCQQDAITRCAHACSENCKGKCLQLNSEDAVALAALERANQINSDFDKDMRRADAFVFAIKAADAALKASGTVITRHNRRPTINVTVDLPTVLGMAENPGQLAGYGPIPASIARTIAKDGRWKRFITDPVSGVLLDYGRETYEPPQELQDFLIARDRTCRFPGCRQPAHLSDLDHVIPWDEGGKTSADNLGALCRRHHNLKTHHGWKVVMQPDGACTWTSPTGQTYYVPARPIMDAV